MEMLVYRFSLDSSKSQYQKTLQGFNNVDVRTKKLAITINTNGDVWELDADHTSAVMYVMPEGSSAPSVNACEIVGNTIFYEVLKEDINAVGITKMQLKLIHTEEGSVDQVLVSALFRLEVSKTIADDSGAESSPQYTALEEAIAKAEEVTSHSLYSIEFDEDYIFHAYYKNGTEYVNDSFTEIKELYEALQEVAHILDDIDDAKADALTEIDNKEASSIANVESARASAVASVVSATTEGTEAVNNAKTESVTAITNIKTEAESNIASAKTEIETYVATSKTEIGSQVTHAGESASLAKSYAVGTNGSVRPNDATDNAKFYYEKVKEIVPQGGEVTGVKGEAETEYRGGNVNITKENLGITVFNREHDGLVPQAPPRLTTTTYFLSDSGSWETPDVNFGRASTRDYGSVRLSTNKGLKIDMDGNICCEESAIGKLGAVKIDGETIVIDEEGTISVPVASGQDLGVIKLGNGFEKDIDGRVSVLVANNYFTGTVKPDNTSITIDEDGTIHATSSGSATISDITNEQWEEEYKEKQDDVLYEISGYESKGDAWESDNIFFDNSNSNLTSVNVESAIKEVNGKVDDETVVNLIEFPYYAGYSLVSKGITFTVNADGSISASGTATSNASFHLYSRNKSNDLLSRIGQGTFTLGGISGGSESTYYIQIGYGTSSAYKKTLADLYDGSVQITINEDLSEYNGQIMFVVKSGVTVENLTVKPMLEVGTVAHDYVPPTSNPKQRLTEQVADTSRTLSNALGSNAWVSTTSYSIGNHVIHNNKLYRCIVACSNQMPPNSTYWVEVSLSSLNTNFMNLFQDGVSKFNVGVHPEVKEVFFDVYIDSTKYYRCQFSGVSSKMNMFYWNGSSWETLI